MDKVILAGIALDNMVKYQAGPFTVLGRFPITIRGLANPLVDYDSLAVYGVTKAQVDAAFAAIDPCWMAYEIKATYPIDAFTLYLDIENDNAITFNDDFAEKMLSMTFKGTPKSYFCSHIICRGKSMTKEKKLIAEEKWEQATIANNFIFYKVMRNNPDVCKELLEILLEMKIDHIQMKQEEEIAIDYEKKSIRLDVYAVGAEKSFNLEMQATDTGSLPERCRYYQSALDIDDLDSGNDYKNLRTSYIIFICVPDIFKKGLAKYTFENLCTEDTSIKLNDRAFK